MLSLLFLLSFLFLFFAGAFFMLLLINIRNHNGKKDLFKLGFITILFILASMFTFSYSQQYYQNIVIHDYIDGVYIPESFPDGSTFYYKSEIDYD